MYDFANMSPEQLLALAEKASSKTVAFTRDAMPSVPEVAPQVKQGRPVFDDPTDIKQLPAIIRRCSAHYVACPLGYVKVAKKEMLRLVKAYSGVEPIKARIDEHSRLILG